MAQRRRAGCRRGELSARNWSPMSMNAMLRRPGRGSSKLEEPRRTRASAFVDVADLEREWLMPTSRAFIFPA